eukprot:12247257-Prorocentrum_lima.AAC.1
MANVSKMSLQEISKHVSVLSCHAVDIPSHHKQLITARHCSLRLEAGDIDGWLAGLSGKPGSVWEVASPTFGASWVPWDTEAAPEGKSAADWVRQGDRWLSAVFCSA